MNNNNRGKGCLREPNGSLPNQLDNLLRASIRQLIEWLVDGQFDINDLISLSKEEINNEKTS